MSRRGIAVLGSTGSIGTQTLQIIRTQKNEFHAVTLTAGKNIDLLTAQITEFQPRLVSVSDPSDALLLRQRFPKIEFLVGDEGNCAAVEGADIDVVVMGIVGFAALAPTIAAVRAKKRVALANKETLVVGGALLKREMAHFGTLCIPVDSEHNAIFQLLEGRDRSQVASIVLTASGGPLWRLPDLRLEDVTPAVATQHPNWKMGPKISVDSATLMNKGLEVIEAHTLFDFPSDQIEVWIHPQSIVHGALWFLDNSCIAHLSKPDMRGSIGFALSYPERIAGVIPKLSLKEMANLEFSEPDNRRFPALGLCRAALAAGPSALVTLNAANEVAVQSFLDGKILFPQIASLIEGALERCPGSPVESLETLFEIDRESRRIAIQMAQSLRG